VFTTASPTSEDKTPAQRAQLLCAHCGQAASSIVGQAANLTALGVKPANEESVAEKPAEKPTEKLTDHWFCCAGCRAVYQVLHSSGLEQFYDLKKSGVCLRAPQPIQQGQSTYASWDNLTREYRLFLEGVHCSACLWLIEQLPFVLVEDVALAELDLGHSLLRIKLKSAGHISRVAQTLDAWGYRPHLISDTEQAYDLQKNENRKRLIELGIAGALAGNIMLMTIPLYAGVQGQWATLFAWISGVLATGSVFYSGRLFFQNVYSSLKQKRFSIDVPILLAIMVAYFYSCYGLLKGVDVLYFDSLSALVFLLLGSRYLLSRLRQLGLGQMESFQFLAAAPNIKVGDITTLTKPGQLEFDGIIRGGRVFINDAVFTGESYPNEYRVGDKVYAGTDITTLDLADGPLKIEACAVGAETRIEKIFCELRNLQKTRSVKEKAFERWAQRLLICVLGLAGATLLYFGLQSRWDEGLQRTLSLLIVTCPCALALATPLAQTLILRKGLRKALLIKDVDAFELAADVKRVIFDKTGTLTFGQMHVDEISIPKDFLPVLRALVWPSRHPISRAVAAHLGWGEVATLENWHEVPGHGIEANYKGEKITLLKPKNLREDERRPGVELMLGEDMVGQIYFIDQIRPEADALISKLRQAGYELGLLSGDRQAVVDRVSSALNFRRSEVVAEASPEQKADWVKNMERQGQPVLFVGDGVNDALAMSHSTLSMAVVGGVENVLKNASVTALRSGLQPVSSFFELANELRATHRMNFIYSTSYNVISGSLAILGFMNPLIAAIVMPLSALTVFVATFYKVGR